MADDSALKLEKAQKLFKAQTLYAQKNSDEPGTNGMGFPDGPTPAEEEESPSIVGRAKQGIGATAKLLDAPRAATGGPALALALKALTGKDAASMQDFGNGLNPTNLKTFPNADTMYERVGVPKGAKMSDYVPGYGEQGKSPWYRPEKGGMLDFSVRGAGGLATDIATDPLTYVSFGAAGAAKKAAQQSAARTVLEQASKEAASPVSKALSMAANKTGDVVANAPGIKQIGEGSEKLVNGLNSSRLGQVVTDLATAPSSAIKKVGKKIYDAPLTAVEHEGQKFGKSEIGDTMYQAGIKSPLGLREKGQAAIDALMGARDQILAKSDAAGGTVNMERALDEAKQTAAEIRRTGIPNEQHIADALESQIAAHQAMVAGEAGTEATKTLEPTGKLDWKGDPIKQEVVVPGKEAIPGRVLPGSMSRRIKTSLYEAAPNSTWSELSKTPQGAKALKPLSAGFRREQQLSTAEALGPKAGADVAELDSAAGGLLSTKKAQQSVQNVNERIANNAAGISGTDAIVGSLGEQGVYNLLKKKGMDLLRLGAMGGGYGLRKAGEGRLTAPAIDTYLRRKLIKANEPGGNDGEE